MLAAFTNQGSRPSSFKSGSHKQGPRRRETDTSPKHLGCVRARDRAVSPAQGIGRRARGARLSRSATRPRTRWSLLPPLRNGLMNEMGTSPPLKGCSQERDGCAQERDGRISPCSGMRSRARWSHPPLLKDARKSEMVASPPAQGRVEARDGHVAPAQGRHRRARGSRLPRLGDTRKSEMGTFPPAQGRVSPAQGMR
jgi:hypothetical protein